MAYQLTILPVIIPPKEDELFSSWLFRLAVKNVTKAHTFCRFHFPGQNFWNRDIDRLIPNQTIERLSLLTEIPFKTIYDLTLRSYEQIIYETCIANSIQKWVLALGIYHRTWKSHGLQFCPGCLSNDEEPYFRKSWRLTLSVLCTRCHTLLHDRCPSCGSPVTFFRSDIGFKTAIAKNPITECSRCGFDLRQSPRYPPVIGTFGFQSKINQTILSGRWRNLHPSREYFDVLYQILKILRSKSKKFQSFNHLIMDGENLRIRELPKGKEFELFNTIQREQLLRIAIWVLERWPDRLIELSKESKFTTSRLLSDNTYLPSWMTTVVTQHLHLPSASELSAQRKKRKKS